MRLIKLLMISSLTIFIIGCGSNSSGDSSNATGTTSDLQTNFVQTMQAKCYGCHANGGSSGGFDFADDINAMKDAGYLVSGSLQDSYLYQKIKANGTLTSGVRMPTTGNYLSETEIQYVEDFITDGLE